MAALNSLMTWLWRLTASPKLFTCLAAKFIATGATPQNIMVPAALMTSGQRSGGNFCMDSNIRHSNLRIDRRLALQ